MKPTIYSMKGSKKFSLWESMLMTIDHKVKKKNQRVQKNFMNLFDKMDLGLLST